MLLSFIENTLIGGIFWLCFLNSEISFNLTGKVMFLKFRVFSYFLRYFFF